MLIPFLVFGLGALAWSMSRGRSPRSTVERPAASSTAIPQDPCNVAPAHVAATVAPRGVLSVSYEDARAWLDRWLVCAGRGGPDVVRASTDLRRVAPGGPELAQYLTNSWNARTGR
jgi:hypothetical protein